MVTCREQIEEAVRARFAPEEADLQRVIGDPFSRTKHFHVCLSCCKAIGSNRRDIDVDTFFHTVFAIRVCVIPVWALFELILGLTAL